MISRISRRALLWGGAASLLSACAGLDGAGIAPVPDGQLEYAARGSSGPDVVFLHGLGVGMETWSQVIDPAGGFARALAYNRPGYGNSAWRSQPRVTGPIVRELLDVTAAAGAGGPFVLVGHSLGGLYALAIAQAIPDRVAGLVLVDPYVVGQFALMEQYMPVQAALIRAASANMMVGPREEFRDSFRLEDEVRAQSAYRGGPVRVIRAEHLEPTASPDYVAARRDRMAQLAQLLGGQHVDAPTGHFVQTERPDMVVEAVRACV